MTQLISPQTEIGFIQFSSISKMRKQLNHKSLISLDSSKGRGVMEMIYMLF